MSPPDAKKRFPAIFINLTGRNNCRQIIFHIIYLYIINETF